MVNLTSSSSANHARGEDSLHSFHRTKKDFCPKYNIINYDYIWQSLLEPALYAVLGVSNNALTMATLLTIIKNKMICQTLACFRVLLLEVNGTL